MIFGLVALAANERRLRPPTRVTVSSFSQAEEKKKPEPPPPPPKPKAPPKAEAKPAAPQAAAKAPPVNLGLVFDNSGPATPGVGGGIAVPVAPKKVEPRAVVARAEPKVCEEQPSKPEPIEKVELEYPVEARQLGLEGRIVLRLFVDAEGRVEKVDVVSGAGEVLDKAAVAAAMQWRFSPARACGAGVPSTYVVARRFELGD